MEQERTQKLTSENDNEEAKQDLVNAENDYKIIKNFSSTYTHCLSISLGLIFLNCS